MIIPKIKNVQNIIKNPDDLLTINENISVAEAAKIMGEHNVGCLLVFDNNESFAGVVTERDMMAKVLTRNSTVTQTLVKEVMTPNVICCDMESDISQVERLMSEHKIRHIPIVENNKPIGMISSRDLIAYRLRSNREMKSAAEEIAMLSAQLKSHKFEDVIDLTINEVPRSFEAERAVLCFMSNTSDEPMIYRNGCPFFSENLPNNEQVKKLSEVENVICDKICTECEILGGKAPRLVIPLKITDKIDTRNKDVEERQGFLCMCRFSLTSENSDEARLYKASLLKDALTVNLTNAKLVQKYEKARQDSEIDPLTGVSTRRVLEKAIKKEHARVCRYAGTFSMAIVDLDNFKNINDSAGHDAGDIALKQVAQTIQDNTRTSDVVIARYGGDEFVLLMPQTNLKGAKILLERIRRQVKLISIPGIVSITISSGVAEWNGTEADTGKYVLKRADEGLYEAKKAGKNCVRAKNDSTDALIAS